MECLISGKWMGRILTAIDLFLKAVDTSYGCNSNKFWADNFVLRKNSSEFHFHLLPASEAQSGLCNLSKWSADSHNTESVKNTQIIVTSKNSFYSAVKNFIWKQSHWRASCFSIKYST